MQAVFQRLGVVVRAAVKTFAKGIKHDGAGLGVGLYQRDDVAQRHAAPLGNARPALDAVVHGDVLPFHQVVELGQGQFHRGQHQPAQDTPHIRLEGHERAPVVGVMNGFLGGGEMRNHAGRA